MSEVIKHGQTSLVFGARQSSYEPFCGGSTRQIIEGDKSDVVALAIQYQNLGYKTEITEGPQCALTVTLPFDEITDPNWVLDTEPAPIWEVTGHDYEQNIMECSDRPIIGGVNGNGGLSSSSKTLIEAAIKNNTPDSPLIDTTKLGDNVDLDTELSNATYVYNLMRAGVEARLQESKVVRRTITVNSKFSCNWSLENNGKLWSRAGLVSAYNIPNGLTNLLPAGDTSVKQDPGGGFLPQTFKGYLEKSPNVQTVSAYKIQISQEWIYGKWSAGESGLYDLAA